MFEWRLKKKGNICLLFLACNFIVSCKVVNFVFRSKAKKSTSSSGWFNWFGGSAGKDAEQQLAAAGATGGADNNIAPVKEWIKK